MPAAERPTMPSQVKLLGDFDGWSRGVDLSAEESAGDSVFTTFSSTLLLPKVRSKGFNAQCAVRHDKACCANALNEWVHAGLRQSELQGSAPGRP